MIFAWLVGWLVCIFVWLGWICSQDGSTTNDLMVDGGGNSNMFYSYPENWGR